MTSRLTEVIVDCHDLDRLAQFWCEVLGYHRLNGGDGWLAIAEGPRDSKGGDDAMRAHAVAPLMSFVLVPEDKSVKNRVHVDVTPIDRTRDEEVERVVALGARRIDIGQGNVPWIVMADPEGNEFCVTPCLRT